jgi:hypothetical protein
MSSISNYSPTSFLENLYQVPVQVVETEKKSLFIIHLLNII